MIAIKGFCMRRKGQCFEQVMFNLLDMTFYFETWESEAENKARDGGTGFLARTEQVIITQQELAPFCVWK